ncbi:MAG: FeoA family protein [Burkholderiaceae bacterium]
MSTLTLDQIRVGTAFAVTTVDPPSNAPEWGQWLEDIGFIAGEQVMLIARAPLGGDPIVVRIGQSTFALRLAEAACVQLEAVNR